MYSLNTISLYLLMFFGIALLIFPDEVQKFAPDNQYMKMLMQYKQVVAVVAITSSIYLYMGSSPQCKSSETASVTISSPLPSEQVTTTQSS